MPQPGASHRLPGSFAQPARSAANAATTPSRESCHLSCRTVRVADRLTCEISYPSQQVPEHMECQTTKSATWLASPAHTSNLPTARRELVVGAPSSAMHSSAWC